MTTADRRYFHGLDLIRVLAAITVIYTHSSAWFTVNGHHWWLSTWVDRYVVAPLGLTTRLSFVPVALFFVISGLVITYVAHRETGPQFVRRRMARIIPLLVLASLAAWLLTNLGLFEPFSGQQRLDMFDLLAGVTLVGFFTTPEVILLGLAWTLLVQIVFYVYIAVTIPLLRRHAWMPFALAAAIVFAVLALTSGSDGIAAYRTGVIAAYSTVLCIGALIGLAFHRKIHPATATLLGTVHFLLFVWADRIGGILPLEAEHPRTVALAVGLVVLVLTARDRLSRSRLVTSWASRTYTVYLVHPLCLYPVLDALVPVVGKHAALLAALVVLLAVTEALHRWFEMPIARWFRSRDRRAPADTVAAGPDVRGPRR
ncbi:acyltransferase [Haloechinothrix sp. LS1_15]|uniref:acyltransferase family protein n=1 Tax=Haloechinothrix sp. LS1_15 TaxID=2652248 RepID=UPI00294AF858|nr:acyltransferase [Haloechinothrix sp. LS1_15]